MRKLLSIEFSLFLLTLAVLAAACIPESASSGSPSSGKEAVSTMAEETGSEANGSDEETLSRFLREYIPYYGQDAETDEQLIRFLSVMIPEFEETGTHEYVSGYTKYEYLHQDLLDALIRQRDGVVPMFSWEDGPAENISVELPSGFFPWWRSVGSYAYASQSQLSRPGCTDLELPYDLTDNTVDELADYMKADLQSRYINQACVIITRECPDLQALSETKTVFCIRKGEDALGTPAYHVMRWTKEGWVHKFDQSGALLYTGDLSESVHWVAEGTYDGEHWFLLDQVFKGPICYLICEQEHSGHFEYTGRNYHEGDFHYYEYAGECPECGAKQFVRCERCSGGTDCPASSSAQGN